MSETERSSNLPEDDRPKLGADELRKREQATAGSTGTAGSSGSGGSFNFGGSGGSGGSTTASAGGTSAGSSSGSGSKGRSSSGGSSGGGQTSTAGGANLDLQDRENAMSADEAAARAVGDVLGDGYVDKGRNKVSRLKRRITRRRVATAALAAGVGAGGGLVLFMSLLPLKTETIVKNLQDRTFGNTESAVESEVDNMLENYLITKVLPAYQRCGTTISKDCQAANFGDNPVDRLYKAWANVRLENTLAKDYGIEFQYHHKSGTWSLKAPGTGKDGDDIGRDGRNLPGEFQRADRAEMRRAIKLAMKDATKWDKVYYRYKVGVLLEQKYGIKRCLIFCGTRDTFAQKAADGKRGMQLLFVQRVVSPLSQTMGIAMECLISPECAPEHTQPNDTQTGTTGEAAGAPTSDFDNQVQHDLVQLAQGYGNGTSAEDLEKLYNKLKDKGFSAAILDEVLAKIGLKDIGGQILDKAAIIGWVNQAANIIVAISNAGQKLTKITYVIKSSAFVGMYMLATTGAAEAHTGKNTAAEVGSLNDLYGPAKNTDPDQPVTGGPAPAEDSRLYQAWIQNGAEAKPSAALLSNPLTSKAYAAASQNSGPNGEICSDNKHPQGNNLNCPEDKAGGGVAVVSNVSNTFNRPPLSYLTDIANAWANTVGGIINFAGNIFGSIIGAIPGVSDITSFIASVAQPFVNFLAEGVIDTGVGVVQGGARTFAQTASGAAIAGADAAQAIGAKVVSPATYVSLVNQQQAQEQQDFKQQPFFARMFSTDSQYSLISRLSLDIPFGTRNMVQRGFANVLNPLGTISHGFAALVSGKASASASFLTVNETPDKVAGVTLNAWPLGDIPKGSPDLWDQLCSDNASYGYMKDNSRNQAAADGPVNPDNGMPVFRTENPCQIMMAGVGSGGGLFDTSLLTADDRTHLEGGAGGAAAPAAAAGATIDMAHLYDPSDTVGCAPGTNDDGIADGYTDGKKVKIRLCEIPNFPVTNSSTQKNGHAVINSRASGAVLAMVTAAKQAGVNMSADNTFRTMSEQEVLWDRYGHDRNRVAPPGYSNHQMGLAIDFNDAGSGAAPGSGPTWTWLDKNAGNFGYKNYPAEAWHWSPTGN